MQLRQRTWIPAMVPWRATDAGFVNDDVVAWYTRFAQGRPGVLVVEATGIRDVASGPLLRIGHPRFVPGLRRLADAVRDASSGETKLLIQILDFLALRRRVTPTKYFACFFRPSAEHRKRVAAALQDERWEHADNEAMGKLLAAGDAPLLEAVLSRRELHDLRNGARERIGDTHLGHIASLPAVLPSLFAEAAARAEASGFDGVELHYAHAYTMASFLSRTNTRDDGYGRTLAGRLRLPIEVLDAVRQHTDPSRFAVGCRILGDEVIEGGTHLDQAAQISVALASRCDFLSISKGGKFDDAKQPKVGQTAYPYTGPSGYECMPTVYSDERGPFARNVELAATLRTAVRAAGHETPIVTAGGICTFEQAEAILATDKADIIAAARQSLADPDWFLKVHTGHGHAIRRCKYTNYCEALDTQHKQVTCQLWDRASLHTPDATLARGGRRRLVAPPWRHGSGER